LNILNRRKLSSTSASSGNLSGEPTLRQIRALFSRADQLKIVVVTIIQISLSILDLISVAFIGLLTALTINGIQSKKPTGIVSQALNSLGVGDLEFQQQAALLGFAAGLLLVLRTVLSLVFTKRLLIFLSLRAAELSSKLIASLLRQPILVIQQKSTQETLFLVTVGVGAITNGVVATGVLFVTDGALLLVMFIGLALVNPAVAFLTAATFGIVAVSLFHRLKNRAAQLAVNDAEWNVQSNQKLIEVLTSYREAIVRNRRDSYSTLISGYRFKMARAQADATFIPMISKYVIEMTLVMGSLVLAASQFLLFDALEAISILSIFLAAGARVAPAILRMQQGAIQIRSNMAVATQTLELWTKLNASFQPRAVLDTRTTFSENSFTPGVSLKNVSFKYPESDDFTLKDINLEIRPGDFIAIAGSSGAGKSTLVDLILGVLEPTHGEVLLSDAQPSLAITKFEGRISYVPQDVLIVDGTVKSNVALGYPNDEISDEQVWESLRSAQLEVFVSQLSNGINHEIGERGTNLSGGQRQRLGLARALYSKPSILVLDEATSALDGQTESGVTEMLLELRGEVTLIVIAHRLSTIQEAQRVIFIKEGAIAAEGSFAEVERIIPEFGKSNLE
jgi:ABC-type multidrug transport system fused ATPase/permease subunit